MLKFVYTIFVGILIVTFIGLGIDAFYPGPIMPDYTQTKDYYAPVGLRGEEPTLTDEEITQMNEEQQTYDKQYQIYSEQLKTYNRDVSIIALIGAIIILAASILFEKQLKIIADGMIFGGVLTLSYSIIRGFSAGDDIFRFIVVAIGLTVSLALGYIKFIKPQQTIQ